MLVSYAFQGGIGPWGYLRAVGAIRHAERGVLSMPAPALGGKHTEGRARIWYKMSLLFLELGVLCVVPRAAPPAEGRAVGLAEPPLHAVRTGGAGLHGRMLPRRAILARHRVTPEPGRAPKTSVLRYEYHANCKMYNDSLKCG